MGELQERFTIKKGELMPTLQVYCDDKEIPIADLVKIANQLANALLDKGMGFKLEKGE